MPSSFLDHKRNEKFYLFGLLFSLVGPLQIYNDMLVIQRCTMDMQIYIERSKHYANGEFHNIFLSQIFLLIIKKLYTIPTLFGNWPPDTIYRVGGRSIT